MKEKLGLWVSTLLAAVSVLLLLFGDSSKTVAIAFALLGSAVIIAYLDNDPPTP